jgi:hypothetical protein
MINDEEVNREIYSNLKYKLAPDAQDKAFESSLKEMRASYFATGQAAAELPQESVQLKEAKVVSLQSYLKWATGVAAVLMVGLFIWAPWNTSLYEDYAISQTLSVAERGQAEANTMSRAAEYYNKKDYAAAKPLFAEAYQAAPEDALTGYYYAITLIETREEDKGRAILTDIYNGESVFKYDAAFYIALSHVKQDQKKEAVDWLNKIPAGNNHYDASQELKKKLN